MKIYILSIFLLVISDVFSNELQNLDDFIFHNLNFQKNRIEINNLLLNDIVEIKYSENKKYVIYTQIENSQMNVFLVDIEKKETIKISNDNFYKFDLSVANNGDYIFSQSYNMISNAWNKSIPISNRLKNKIYDDEFYCKNIITNDNIYSIQHSFNGEHYLIDLLKKQKIKLNFKPSKIFQIKNTIYIEGYDDSSQKIFYSLIKEENRLRIYKKESNDEYCSYSSKKNQIKCIKIKNKKELKALEYFYTYDPLFSMSKLNNYDGRISWYANEKLNSFVDNYYFYKKYNIPAKIIVHNAIDNILQSFNNDSNDQNNFGWKTKRYSVNQDESISLLINNSTIMYSILKSINSGIIKDSLLEKKAVDFATQIYSFYNSDFDENYNLYFIKKGIPYKYDGIIAPWNWNNTMANMLIELYKLTNNIIYLERVNLIVNAFFREIIYTDDGGIAWSYWPNKFYEGWNLESDISTNTPVMMMKTDKNYEDVSHATLSINFIQNYCSLNINNKCKNKNFDKQFKIMAERTYSKSYGFSKFISGKLIKQKFDEMFIPYGKVWFELNENHQKNINLLFSKNTPFYENDIQNALIP